MNKKIKLGELKTTVQTIKRKEPEGVVNQENPNAKLPEHPPFAWAPGMVDGQGEVINPERANE